jgi:hypothetical protein
LDENLFRFVFPQSEIVAADFDFNGIAHGRKADKLDLRSNEKSHFHEASAACGGNLDFGNCGLGADGAGGERLGGHGLSGFHLPWLCLDENGFGQFLTDTKARVANLADHVRLAADKLDPLFLAKAHFAEACPKFRSCS